jgi:hypothetical protein
MSLNLIKGHNKFYNVYMNKSPLSFLFAFVISICYFETKAQGNLTFVGPVHYTCNFPYFSSRAPIDTIIIPSGYAVKLEGDNICRVSNQDYLFNGANVEIIGAIDLKISGINKPAILSQYPYFSYQNSNKLDSFPMWLGSGVHYLHFSNSSNYTSSIRYSLHGLLFKIQ